MYYFDKVRETEMQMYLLCFLLFLFNSCFCVQLPPSFKKCSRNREDFQKCLVGAVEDAIHQLDRPFKEVGLPSIDPLKISSLSLSPGRGVAGFEQKYNNLSIEGYSKVKITKFEIDFDKKLIELRGNIAKIVANFNYDFNGKILVFPFHGKGPGVMTINELEITLDFKLEEYEKNGDKYYKIVEGKVNLAIGHMHFKLDNLFDGDERLGKNINDVFNDNWEAIMEDVKPNYEQALAGFFTSIFGKLLERVSVSELFPQN